MVKATFFESPLGYLHRCVFAGLDTNDRPGLRKKLRSHDVNLLNEMDEEDKKMFDKII